MGPIHPEERWFYMSSSSSTYHTSLKKPVKNALETKFYNQILSTKRLTWPFGRVKHLKLISAYQPPPPPPPPPPPEKPPLNPELEPGDVLEEEIDRENESTNEEVNAAGLA